MGKKKKGQRAEEKPADEQRDEGCSVPGYGDRGEGKREQTEHLNHMTKKEKPLNRGEGGPSASYERS